MKLPGFIEANRVRGSDQYFIRSFNREFLQYLVEKLKLSYCNVTCTGTPAIGKSVFIHYFIEEWLKLNICFSYSTRKENM